MRWVAERVSAAVLFAMVLAAPARGAEKFAARDGGFAAGDGAVRLEVPAVAGAAPARVVLDGADAIAVGTRVRFAHAARSEGAFDLASLPAAGALHEGAVRWTDALPGADLVHTAGPRALKTALVVKEAPRALPPGAAGAVFFEEEIRLPAGWRAEGIDAAASAGLLPGAVAGAPEPGFARIDQHLYLVDAAGALRATIEAPRVFEAAPGGAEAIAFAEVRFDALDGRLVYRTGAPAAWLADPARRFPVVFDPAISANVPQFIAGGATYAFTPEPGRWNVVAVSAASPADYDIAIVGAASQRGAPDCDFVIADGHAGPITPASVLVSRYGFASGSATLEHATPGTIRVGIDTAFPWNANEIVAVFEIEGPVAGIHEIAVDGTAWGLRWAVFGAPLTSAWKGRGFAVAGFDASPTPQTFPFGGGAPSALVIWRDDGAGASGTVTVRWPGTPSLALVQDTPRAVASGAAAAQLAFTPRAGAWNAVGVHGDDWEMTIGGATSSRPGATTDFCIADGRAGAIAPTDGTALQVGGFGGATVEHSAHPAGAGALVPGVAATYAWGAGDVLRVFEIDVPAPMTTPLHVGGVSGVSCALFAPAASAGWAARASAAQELAAGAVATVDFPVAGTWALVVFRDGAAAPAGGALAIDWVQARPVPVLNAIAPQTVTAGSPQLQLVVTGADFAASSVVRVNGADRATTFVGPGRLDATILASDIAAPGTLAITVFTPAPGGGTSAAIALVVQPAPGGTTGGSGSTTGGATTGGGATGGTTTTTGGFTTGGVTTGGIATGGVATGGAHQPPSFGHGGRKSGGGGGGCAASGDANPGAALPWAALAMGLALARLRPAPRRRG